MKIVFTLLTTMECPDADIFPPKEDLENEIAKLFEDECGLIVKSLKVTDYRRLYDEN